MREKNPDILSFFDSIGVTLKKETKNQYRGVDHNSLVVNPVKNLFFWNSKGIGGNAYTYCNKVLHLNYSDSKKLIDNNDIKIEHGSENKYIENKQNDFDIKEIKVNNNNIKAKEHLIGFRKLSSRLVNKLIDRGLIGEDENHNVVFYWYNNNKVVGANLVGTYLQKNKKNRFFKKVMPTKETNFGFNLEIGDQPYKNIVFFEDSIDLLSYLELNIKNIDNSYLVSMDGLKHETIINVLKQHLDEYENVKLAVDNDFAGHNFINKMQGFLIKSRKGELEFEEDVPVKNKDWNELLIHLKEGD